MLEDLVEAVAYKSLHSDSVKVLLQGIATRMDAGLQTAMRRGATGVQLQELAFISAALKAEMDALTTAAVGSIPTGKEWHPGGLPFTPTNV